MKLLTLNNQDDSISIVTTGTCDLVAMVDYAYNKNNGGIHNILKVNITSAATTILLSGRNGAGIDIDSVSVYNKGTGDSSFRLFRGDFPISNVVEITSGNVVKINQNNAADLPELSVGHQEDAIEDIENASEGTELKINAILAVLRAHGLIADE